MWRCGHGFGDGTRILLKVDLHSGEILVNHLDEFWSQSDYVTSAYGDEDRGWTERAAETG
ncbi:MAG TPA: hypothetical protein VJ036_05440 [bacterium]|jgi:hypothetical protein|nr:hypothetical protein [bacterium]